MPPLALTPNEFLLALVRGVFVASVLSSFGSSLFLYALAPKLRRRSDAGAAMSIAQRCRRLVWWSLLAALAVALAWLFLEAGAIADTESGAQVVLGAPSVLLETRFGQILSVQMLALLAAAIATVPDREAGRLSAAAFTCVAVLLESGHGHAFAMSQGVSALLLSQALHLVAAGAWLGALLPLLIVVRDAPLDAAALTVRRFSSLGTVAVTVLAATAMFQGWVLGGGVARTLGTAYGWVLLIKAALFIALIGLAAFNRFRATPALATARAENAKLALQRSIAVETVIGLSIVLAASLLSGLEPGMHAAAI
jgi:putative copper resistance protein D